MDAHALRKQGWTFSAIARHLVRQRLTGVSTAASPHSLRWTSCTAGLISGVPLRDLRYALRHADARTTIGYDTARANLDRHSAHSVAAYLAGMTMGKTTSVDAHCMRRPTSPAAGQ